MNENAYQSPTKVEGPETVRGVRWAFWAGIVCLLVAALCVVITVVGMILAFQTVDRGPGTPAPEDLGQGISNALIPSCAAVPVGLAGVILVIVGLVSRRSIPPSQPGVFEDDSDS